jgi:DNA-binding response OmpR family regulator
MVDGVDAQLTSYLLSQIDDRVVRAGTLAEAQQRLSERFWSAIVLDTELPDGSGFEFLATLAELHTESGILIMSGSRDVLDMVRALNEGADDYVVRPYQPAELLARLKALLRRSVQRLGSSAGSIVRVGGVELDMNELAVKLPGNRRERLTPNEMRLLHYLMIHSQRVVEHRELLARLFGGEHQPESSNAVGVYMRRVRRKIESNPGQPRYIVTIRGSGYRFQAEGYVNNANRWPASHNAARDAS